MKHSLALLLALGLTTTFALVGCDAATEESQAPDMPAAENAEEAPDATLVPVDYPLTTCVVSGEALGSMGKPVLVKHEGRDVYLCCESCLPDFEANPLQYMVMLDAARATENDGPADAVDMESEEAESKAASEAVTPEDDMP